MAIVTELLRAALVPRLSTAALATGVVLAALASLASGVIMQTVRRVPAQMKRLHYLYIPMRSAPATSVRDPLLDIACQI